MILNYITDGTLGRKKVRGASCGDGVEGGFRPSDDFANRIKQIT